MSQDDVAVVCRMYEAFHSGDTEGAVAHFAADVAVDTAPRLDGEVGKISGMNLYPDVTDAREAAGLPD